MSLLPRRLRASWGVREQAVSDADQTLSETDQTSSDVDQSLSDRDQAAALADQQVSDREQALADRKLHETPPSERVAQLLEYERAHAERSEGTISRAANAVVRQLISTERDEQATRRDENALERDQIAVDRDAASDLVDREPADLAQVPGESSQSAKAALEAAASTRDLAMTARVKAAGGRERAARDREAAARDRELLRREMERAQLDEATGAYRREMGEILVRQEMSRAARTKGHLALGFVDVDGFERPGLDSGQDGHEGLLQAVFSGLRAVLRPFDPVIRWGATEFVCVASGISAAEARTRIECAQADLAKLDAGVTVSFGLTALEPGDTLDALVERANANADQPRR